jgi:predicted DNA binding CopG/RHH family protein
MIKLDKEEKEILDSFERGEWVSTPDLKKEIKKHREFAAKTLKKDRRVNIRMSSKVLEALKTVAAENGIPYQTLMSSILHKYVSGRLIDKSSPNNSTK